VLKNCDVVEPRGPIAWPTRLPDEISIDFFILGHLKEYVHQVPTGTPEYLVTSPQAGVTTVMPTCSGVFGKMPCGPPLAA
jgi:hypothetical protein